MNDKIIGELDFIIEFLEMLNKEKIRVTRQQVMDIYKILSGATLEEHK
jgi:hypothetical protein